MQFRETPSNGTPMTPTNIERRYTLKVQVKGRGKMGFKEVLSVTLRHFARDEECNLRQSNSGLWTEVGAQCQAKDTSTVNEAQ